MEQTKDRGVCLTHIFIVMVTLFLIFFALNYLAHKEPVEEAIEESVKETVEITLVLPGIEHKVDLNDKLHYIDVT